jgi:hypothetical protein
MISRIEGPIERLGVRTPAELRRFQQTCLDRANVRRRLRSPEVRLLEPFLALEPPHVFIGQGAWRVTCACGEVPPADPNWKLACCAGCGAIFEGLQFPDNREQIEAVLSLRRDPTTRNWRAPWPVDLLIRQNLKNHMPVPAGDDEVAL